MKKLILVAAVVVAAIVPSTAFAGTFTGVVVGKTGSTLAIASKSGAVHSVRTRAHARIGARVRVNGASVRVIGAARHARIHAVVVKRAGGATLLAAGHSLLAVRGGRSFASLAGSGPKTGAVVNSTVSIVHGQLLQQSTQVVGQSGSITVQAQVTQVAAGSITVLVNGTPFTIPLPAGIQLPSSLVGQFVTLTLNLSAAGPTAEADDENENEDNDDQGEDQNDDNGSATTGQQPGDDGDSGDD
jgi:hypothetical protein